MPDPLGGSQRIPDATAKIVVLLSLGAGAASLAVSVVDAESLARLADALAPDGSADRYGAERITRIQRRMTWLGLYCFALAGAFQLVNGYARRQSSWALDRGLAAFERLWPRLRRFATREPGHAACLLGFTIGAFVMSLGPLGQSIRCDEATTYLNSISKLWISTISTYSSNNHVLYSLMAKPGCWLLEDHTLCVRLPALVAGVLLVPASYAALRTQLGRSVGLLTAAAVSSSVYTIDFATNGRGYTTLALVFMILLTLLPQLLRPRRSHAWASFIVFSAIGFCTIPVMAYPFAILLVWLALGCLGELPREAWWPFALRVAVALLAIGVLVSIFYAPAFTVAGVETVIFDEIIEIDRVQTQPALAERVVTITQRIWKDWAFGQPALLSFGLLASLIVGVFLPGLGGGFRRLLIASVAGILGVLLVTRAIPPTWIFLFLMPVYLGLGFASAVWLARALADRAGRDMARLVAPVAILVFAANASTQLAAAADEDVRWYVGYRDAREATELLVPLLEPDDRVTAHPIELSPIAFYMNELGAADLAKRTYRGRALGDVYLVDAAHASVGQRMETLRADGFSEMELVGSLAHSRIFRFRRPVATDGGHDPQVGPAAVRASP